MNLAERLRAQALQFERDNSLTALIGAKWRLEFLLEDIKAEINAQNARAVDEACALRTEAA